MKYTIKKLGREEWILLAKEFRDYNYTHYWEYSQHAADRINASSEHIAIIDKNDNTIAVFNIRIKKVAFKLGGIAYISGGPMIEKGSQNFQAVLFAALEAIKDEYVKTRGFVLRISQRHKSSSFYDKEIITYEKLGFVKYKSTNATILIDLSIPLEKIRKNFHQKWRNILNKSEKNDIQIIAGDSISLFKDFSGLFKDLLEKKKFSVDMDDHFYKHVQDNSLQEEKFHLAIAYANSNPIAGHLSSIKGDTSVYILGATNEIGRKLGAAYYLQWHVINESKIRGCQWYDLGGIDKKENPHVYQFKNRMGGEETLVGFVFQIHSGLQGWITLNLEKTYNFIRTL